MKSRARDALNNPLAACLKGIGHWTGPNTRTGRSFRAAESLSGRCMERLATHPGFLRFMGRSLGRGFAAQEWSVRVREEWWRLWRLPVTSDIADLRTDLRRLTDQIEALENQIEALLQPDGAACGPPSGLKTPSTARPAS